MQPNAFTPEFLDHLAELDEPATALEASTSGPWRVVALTPELWGVLQDGDSTPRARFKERDLALLAAAMLPATGRSARLVLFDESEARGFPVGASSQGATDEPMGWLTTFDAETLELMNAALHLLLSPASLALLLEAAGSTALRRAGALLAGHLNTQSPDVPARG